MKMNSINDSAIWVTDDISNSAAVDLGKKIIVIDSMIGPKPAQDWRNIVEKTFGGEVEILLLTHKHGDHVLGSQVFTDCPIISSFQTKKKMEISRDVDWTKDNIQEWIDSTKNKNTGLENLNVTLPSLIFTDKLKIIGEKRSLVFKNTGGHTDGSSYAWIPELELIIAGDLLFNKRYPYGHDETVDPIKWLNAIDEMIALKPKVVIPGHGELGTLEDLIEFDDYLRNIINLITKKLEEGLSPEEISNFNFELDYYSDNREDQKINSLKKWAEILAK